MIGQTATRRQLMAAAKKFGATVQINYESRDGIDIDVLSPDGYHWRCDEVHSLVGHASNETTPRGEVYGDLVSRMMEGLRRCECDEQGCCEWWAGPEKLAAVIATRENLPAVD